MRDLLEAVSLCLPSVSKQKATVALVDLKVYLNPLTLP